MSGPILVVDSSEIRAGKLGEVKAGVEELVAFVEANEAEPLAYDIYFDDAGMLMTVVQIHPDSEFAGTPPHRGRACLSQLRRLADARESRRLRQGERGSARADSWQGAAAGRCASRRA
jgi:hypothetical protein